MERIPESEAIAAMADARRYSQVMSRRLVQHEYCQLAREVVRMGVPSGGRVLDVGTGPGFVAIEVARLLQGTGCQVVGLDLSAAMLVVAAENGAQQGLSDLLTWREGDARAMPFDDDEFDAVVSSGSLHHWEDPQAVVNEIARVLKPGGHCIIRDSKRLQRGGPRLFAWAIGLTLPRDFREHYWHSIRSSYTPQELTAILETSHLRGWRIVEDLLDLMVVKEG
ncbi:MAG: class I SAM-dependent methyltransferase [Chloroflexota bacterium]